jgi:FixJ family two-component response regulator
MARGMSLIILVEDDDGLRDAFIGMLSVSGFGVQAFSTAEGAREGAPWDDAACLVADVRLPGMSGFELVRWLRDRPGRRMPMIVITAAPTEAARDMAESLGVYAFLEKPVKARTLVAAIHDAIHP